MNEGISIRYFDDLANAIEATVDLDHLLEITKAPTIAVETSIFEKQTDRKLVHFAVAKDAAFNFYYEENLELLRAYGAELHFFSPLKMSKYRQSTRFIYRWWFPRRVCGTTK